jgi:hypothetical protein
VNVVTAFKDLVGIFLLVALLPVWIVVGLGAVVVIVTRQLLWWARGNTTSPSRSTAPVTARRQFRTSRATHGVPDRPDLLETEGVPTLGVPTLAGAPAPLRSILSPTPGTGNGVLPNEVLR